MTTANEPRWVIDLRGACRSDHPLDGVIVDVLDRVVCFPSHPRFAEVLRHVLDLVDLDELLTQRTYLHRCVVAEERCAPLPDVPPPPARVTPSQDELIWYTSNIIPDYRNLSRTARTHGEPRMSARACLYRVGNCLYDMVEAEQFGYYLRIVTEILVGLRDADTER